MSTAELQAGPRAPTVREPTNDDLVMALLRLGGDIAGLLTAYDLTPDRFLAFANDPKVREVLTAYDELSDRRWRHIARTQQEAAATNLARALKDSPTPVETRRAATALARLATNMLKDAAGRPSLRAELAALADQTDHPADPIPSPPTPSTPHPHAPPQGHTHPLAPSFPHPPRTPHSPRTPALPAA